MRWNKIDTGYWECVFVNVPFHVKVLKSTKNGVLSILYFCLNSTSLELDKKEYKTIDDAKSDVESFVLSNLYLWTTRVQRECLEAKIMTWRKLKEQLDQIPEDQMDEEIKVLDTGYDWCGTPAIVYAAEDQIQNDDNGHDVTEEDVDFCNHSVVVEKGHYYLHTEL